MNTPPPPPPPAKSPVPVEFRGDALESHSKWPISWEAPDADKLAIVMEQVSNRISRHGMGDYFTVTTEGLTVTVDRVTVTVPDAREWDHDQRIRNQYQ